MVCYPAAKGFCCPGLHIHHRVLRLVTLAAFFCTPSFFCYSQLPFCRHYLPTLLPRWHSLKHTTSPLLNRSLLYSSSPLHVARQKQSLAFLHSHTSPHLLSQHFNVCRRSGKKSKQKVATGLGCSAHPLDGCVLFICVLKNGMYVHIYIYCSRHCHANSKKLNGKQFVLWL